MTRLSGINDTMGEWYLPQPRYPLNASTASHSSTSRHASGPSYWTTDSQNALPVDGGHTDRRAP